MMKYYVYSFIWKTKGSSSWNAGTGLQECESVVEFFETIASQPEDWAVTSFAEITKAEYKAGIEKGIIG